MATDPEIQKKASDIRNKIYGKEVRESLASGLEEMSEDVVENKERQDEVEGQFQDVLDETTNKDFNSAPEIRAARDGNPNLKARLDKEHQEVTAQLAQTEQEISNLDFRKSDKTQVEATNKRIDTLVIGSGDANAEVNDAKVSNYKNKTFDTIKNRFEEIEKNNYLPFYNLVANGNFSEGTDRWQAFGGVLSVVNHSLVHENIDSNTAFPSVSTVTDYDLVPGHKYFIKCKYTNLNPNTPDAFLLLEGTTSGNNNKNVRIVKDVGFGSEVIFSEVVQAEANLTGKLSIRVRNNYSSPEQSIGENFKIENVIVVNLTDLFGYGNEPTAKNFEQIISHLPNRWLSDDIENSKHLISYLNKNVYSGFGSLGLLFTPGGVPDFNYQDNVLTLNRPRLLYKDKFLVISEDVLEIPLFSASPNYGVITFDTKTMTFSDNDSAGLRNTSEDSILIAVYNNEKTVSTASSYTIDGESVSGLGDLKDRVTELEESLGKVTRKPYLFGDFSKLYQTTPCESMVGVLTNYTSDDIYREFDNLPGAGSNLITKNLLGYGSDSNGQEDTSLPIYEYVFNPPTESSLIDSPTILIQSGTHGDEKSPPWSILSFMRQLLSKWQTNDTLASIKSNVTIKIVPVANPGGYNDNTRTNRNGVNLNRNYSHEWELEESLDKGSSPMSELETQITHDWMMRNKNALMYVDYHNSLSTASYIIPQGQDIQYIYSSVVRRMSDFWRLNYGIDGSTTQAFGRVIDPWGYGFSIQNAHRVAGINLSFVLEIGAYSKNEEPQNLYDAEVIEKGVDLLANTILGVLNQYNR